MNFFEYEFRRTHFLFEVVFQKMCGLKNNVQTLITGSSTVVFGYSLPCALSFFIPVFASTPEHWLFVLHYLPEPRAEPTLLMGRTNVHKRMWHSFIDYFIDYLSIFIYISFFLSCPECTNGGKFSLKMPVIVELITHKRTAFPSLEMAPYINICLSFTINFIDWNFFHSTIDLII